MRNRELVIWLMEVVARYSVHTAEENGHSFRIIVLISRGRPANYMITLHSDLDNKL